MDWFWKLLFGVPLPTDEMIRWQFDVYGWLLRDSGFRRFQRRELVLPLNENFPITARESHDIAEEVYMIVKRYVGLQRDAIRLVPQEENKDPREEMQGIGRYETSGAAGTFSMTWDHDQAEITYDPKLVGNLPALIATLAHELSHYYHATMAFEAPGGKDGYEPATDLTAVYLGFGIFLANSAYDYSSGAIVSRKGYLTELSLSYALAIFTELKQMPPTDVWPHLKTNPRSYYKSAVKDLSQRWSSELEDLRRIKSDR